MLNLYNFNDSNAYASTIFLASNWRSWGLPMSEPQQLNGNLIHRVMAKRPLPDQIKSLKGTLRKVRVNTQQPRPTGDLVGAPDYMSPGARAAWQYAIDAAPPELLKRLDMGVLEIWACAADIYRQAQVMIQAEGLLTLAPKTGVPMVNPYLSIANKQALLMTKAAVEMGFTPASRSKVSAATPSENVVDAWSEIVA